MARALKYESLTVSLFKSKKKKKITKSATNIGRIPPLFI